MPCFRILSVDGGGMRGIIPAIWLKQLQSEIDCPLHECFDLICGTSTGSIVAGAVALGHNIDDAVNLYKEFGPSIFPTHYASPDFMDMVRRYLKGPIYPDDPLEDSLAQVFGRGTLISHARTRLMIPSYDVFSRSMFLMRSYDDRCESVKMWEACKASSSAPTYFRPHMLKRDEAVFPLIDGGVFANNPALLGIAEAVKLHNKDSMAALEDELKIIVISLGTGNTIRPIDHNDASEWGAIQWARPLIDVIMDGASELTNHCARQIVSDEHYIRLQVDLGSENVDLDDARPQTIEKLKLIAQSYIDRTPAVDKIKKLLFDAAAEDVA